MSVNEETPLTVMVAGSFVGGVNRCGSGTRASG